MRGIFPQEAFERKKVYDMPLVTAVDPGLNKYLEGVLQNVSKWLDAQAVHKLVLVVTNTTTEEPLERWVFDVQPDECTIDSETGKPNPEAQSNKPIKEIQDEIRAIIRQITSSSTFLPLYDFPVSFDLLIHSKPELDLPQEWEESDPKYIAQSAEVKLRSFTTKVHRVEAMVSYADSSDV